MHTTPRPIHRASESTLREHGANFTMDGLRFHFQKLNEYTNPTGGGLDKRPMNTINWVKLHRQQRLDPPTSKDNWIFLNKKAMYQVANHLLGLRYASYWTGSTGRSTLLGLDIDDHDSVDPETVQTNSIKALNLFTEMAGWQPVTCQSNRGIHGFLILDRGWQTIQATNEMWHETIRIVHAEAKRRQLVANLECKGKARIINETTSYGGVLLKDPFYGMNPTDKELMLFWKTLEERRLDDRMLDDQLTTLSNDEFVVNQRSMFVQPQEPTGVIHHETFQEGSWGHNCRNWAEHGLQSHDSVAEVVFQLSKWLYFIEFWKLAENERYDKVVDSLRRFCLTKHNGYISRLNQGDSTEVMTHVSRIVKSMIDHSTDSAKACFQRIREKRDSGLYKDVWLLEPLLLSDICIHTPVKLNVCCSVSQSVKKKTPEEWVYVPDLTPLPDFMGKRIQEELQKDGARKKTYPKIVGFLNHLKNEGGEARLSVKALAKMGFTDHRARQHVHLLREMGLTIEIDGSPVAGVGKKFVLSARSRELFGMDDGVTESSD